MTSSRDIFLFLVTGVYLLFELAFNARLLDVVGATLDRDAVDEIEFFGRIISGIALTLVMWPIVLSFSARRGFGIFYTGALLLIALLSGCLISYTIQEEILRMITANSTAAQKRSAATLVTLTGAIHSEIVDLDGLPMDKVDFASPEGKTFLAILPALALSTDNLEEKTERELDQIVRKRAEHAVGGAVNFYNNIYLPSEAAIKESFNAYLKIADPHLEQVKKIPAEQAKAYRQYRNGLGRYTPNSLPKYLYGRVREQVRDNGVDVSRDWDPRDKAGFYRAVEKSIHRRIDPRYEIAMSSNFGFYVSSDLSFDGFVRNLNVQYDWHRKLGTPRNLTVLTGWSFDDFKRQLFDPWMDEVVEKEVGKLLSPVADFEPRGKNYSMGVEAIRAAYVPLVAFIFSTIGALVHTFKTVSFGLMVFFPTRKAYVYSGVGCAMGVLAFLWVIPAATAPNHVSQSLLFTKLEQDTVDKAGPGTALIMRSLVQAQTEFYPISEAIRTNVLFGIRYELD